jgi:hypothetical protein
MTFRMESTSPRKLEAPGGHKFISAAEQHMYNCNIHGLWQLPVNLTILQTYATLVKPPVLDDLLTEKDKSDLHIWLGIAFDIATKFEISDALNRIGIFRDCIDEKKGPFTYRRMVEEIRVLGQSIASGLKDQLIYRYPTSDVRALRSWQAQWKDVVDKFPSAQADIFSGVDLLALGHNTASVFHFMRVLEHGLRALAADVGKNFDVQNWQNIIEQIEAEIRTLSKTLRSGQAKGKRLQFLAESAKEFMYFKDGWRNFVSHNHAAYDQEQARAVCEHVRVFMTILASRLREKRKPVRRRAAVP